MTETLVLDGISKRIGGVQINEDVTIRLAPGERRALIGANGAGKTTLLNMAAGLMPPTSGRVLLHGKNVTALPAHRRARLGLARTFQITTLVGSMTVAQNVALAVQAPLLSRGHPLRSWSRLAGVWDRVYELLDAARLTERATTVVAELPYGEQRRLEIVIAAATRPSVVLLDEPGAGLTTQETEELLQLVFDVAADLTVLFIDHDVDLALRLATSVTVLHQGRVLQEGTPTQTRNSGVLDDIYLRGAARARG
jgi:branched-chain amino acid transport system ATP-binding protein